MFTDVLGVNIMTICRSCGTQFDGTSGKTVCDACKSNFLQTEANILASDKAKYIRYCKYCGRPFIAAKQVTYSKTNKTVLRATTAIYCDTNFTECKNCSKPIKFSPGSAYVPEACSKQCRDRLKNASFVATCNRLYGVDYPMQSKQIVDTYRRNSMKKYGVDNPSKAPSVKAKYRQTCMDKYGVPCALQSESAKQKSKQTCVQRYGVENTSSLESVKQKRRSTNIKRYGVKNITQSEEFKDRMKKYYQEKYGVSYASQVPEVRAKISQSVSDSYKDRGDEIKKQKERTSLEHYGVTHPFKSEEVKQKRRHTLINKYGSLENAYKVQTQTFKEHCLQRYGVDNPNKLSEVDAAKRETWLKKYGVSHPMKCKEIKDKVRNSRIHSYAQTIDDIEARKRYLEFCENPVEYIKNSFDHKPSLIEISHSIGGLDCTSVSQHIPREFHCLLGTYQTSMELEVSDFIKELDSSIKLNVRDRSVISPYELDFYLPEYNVALEINPTYTHNSSIPMYGKTEVLDKKYHAMKSKRCNDKGIRLFHVFGYEWHCKQDVVKSMIRNMLNKTSNRYYARELTTKYINGTLCESFLNQNHLQGNMYASVRLALTDYDGNVLCVMTFARPRLSMGKVDSLKDDVWELSRFCNKLNTTVVGGASKLFKKFVQDYKPSKIISFSDIAHTTGSLYTHLGFTQCGQVSPSYVWVNLRNDTYYTRVSCQKRNLCNLFNDNTLDTKNKTEQMIMVEHGYVQVFDSGKIKWQWIRN